MPSKLKTEWKRVGRSGKTIDGRDIDPQWLLDAAENYDPEIYSAQIWPEHIRSFSMGTVKAVRAEENSEGGVDLFAQLAPNDIYLSINKAEQKLFTSMELLPNFRDTGKHYLSGLAATGDPASVATTEIRFAAIKNDAALISDYIEDTIAENDDDSQPPRWFSRFFNTKPEGDMSKEDLNKIQEGLTALTERFNAAFPAEEKPKTPTTPANTDTTVKPEEFSELKTSLTKLAERFNAAFPEGGPAAPVKPTADSGAAIKPEEFKALQDSLTKLTEDFKAATKEQPGTDGGDHVNDGEDLNAYV